MRSAERQNESSAFLMSYPLTAGKTESKIDVMFYVVEDATVKIGHNVRTTNKWVGFNPNNILNNTGL